MSTYLSPDDLQEQIFRFGLCAPNRSHVAQVVRNLATWTDSNSDGWAYWPKPRAAAAQAIEEIHAYTIVERVAQEQRDLTDAQVRSVLAPIKAFCTRQERLGLMTPTDRNRILAG